MSILVLQIVLMGKRGLVALLSLSTWCLVLVVWLLLLVPWVYLQLVTVVCPDHTHLLFLGDLVLSLYASSEGSGESAQMRTC